MPRGDRSGPNGMGPMTGRGAGYCAGFAAPGFATSQGWTRGVRGRGMGYGCGFGRRGAGPQYYAPQPAWPFTAPPVNHIDEHALLAREAQALEQQLKALHKRMDEITPQQDD